MNHDWLGGEEVLEQDEDPVLHVAGSVAEVLHHHLLHAAVDVLTWGWPARGVQNVTEEK